MTTAASGPDRHAIAIIGLACRFPGADAPADFWSNLCNGRESIRVFSEAELLAAGVAPNQLQDRHYVRAAPVLSDIERFDAAFFGYSPREAALTDPQHRLFLEVAWEAFEDAGYHPEACPGVVGVVAGGGGVVSSYLVAYPGHPALSGDTATLPHIGNDKDFLATRVSYKLNLTGPSLTVQTACSTSLVAVHLAGQSLRVGECDMVLAGVSSVRIPQLRGYLAERGQVHSRDGHCRAFDAAGQGAIFGSGVAAVLLRRLDDAVAAGDHIYAVIKSTAVTNDGGHKVSYTAPSVMGQARAMVEALTLADVAPDTVSYVECHAAGTNVGDPLEIQALTRAFRTGTARTGFCAVGSVKTNIGHPEQAAGLAGLIKTALALKHARIPPSLHFTTPNPDIDFANSPFFVNTALREWAANGHLRRAAVNSLGIGGTNAFAVLEEAPAPPPRPVAAERPVHVLTLSAKTAAALVEQAARFRTALREQPDLRAADVCFTSNVSRSQFPYRLAVTGGSPSELAAKLERVVAGPRAQGRGADKKIAFLFTGQGAQYHGMAADLYRTHPTFREALDRCAEAFRSRLERPLLAVLFEAGESAALDQTAYTQPVLFALEYALARLWQSWGVSPAAVLGHSLGEIAAACVAGAVEFDEAVEFIVTRGRLMQELPAGGAMVAVFAAEEGVRRALVDRPAVVVAAVNGPENTVISGPRDDVQTVVDTLRTQGVECKPLALANGFHSPLVEPMCDALEAAASRVSWKTPHVPLVSNFTGQVMAERPDARYWRQHARHAVRFADGVRTLRALGCEIFLEIGPGSTLLGMASQVLAGVSCAWLPSLSRQKPDWQVLLESLQALYLEGAPITWEEVHRGAGHRRVSLPTYPFQRKRFWVDETAPTAVVTRAVPQPAPEADFHEWLYTVGWQARPRPSGTDPGARASRWLVFSDAGGVGPALARTLERGGDHCQIVPWTVDCRRLDDIRTLVNDAVRDQPALAGVVYARALDTPPLATMTPDQLEIAHDVSARGALQVARALSEARTAGVFGGRLWLVTRNAQRVSETDPPSEAVQAQLWGLGRSLAQESPGLWGGLIDLPAGASQGDAEAVAAELRRADDEDQVAFRAGTRFVPRLGRFTRPSANGGLPSFRSDATYLITGGLGTIGLRTAQWLVEHEGVRSLVLTGRRGAADRQGPALEALRRHGARVLVIAADVSLEADVRRVMDALRDLPPLRGVIHGAGVLDNEIVEHLDWERFAAVTRPKVEGAWLLHRATREHPLDFFVVQSSLLSLTGSAGQSNYTAGNAFLDALVSHRQALGLPATAINWTAWDEGGLATTVGARAQEAWRANGWRYIPPDAAVRVFAQLMHPPVDRVAVIIADWPRYLRQFPKAPPLYSGLGGEATTDTAPASRPDVRQRLAEAGEADRRAILIEFLGRQVMDAMGFDEPIDARRPLSDVGLDSLMAVNVAARLETALGIPVPVVKLIRGPSIEHLVEELAPRLNGVAAAPPATERPPSTGTSKIAGHGWLVFPRPNPSARMRLFCFPYAGGNAATYRPWADGLGADVELVAVDPPGRANRIHEAPIDRLDDFLAALGPAMTPFLDKPAAFFGHCLGGLTAFETARRLRQQGGLDLRHLFVSGARAPRRLNRPGRFEENLLARLLERPEFDARVALYDQAEDVVAEMIRQFNIGLTEDFLASAELRTLLMPAIRAEFRMGAHYRFTAETPWETAITCFTGIDDPYVTREDALGWSEHTRRLFRLHLRAGAHFLVVDDRDFIVETITRELER
jgi:acyl transferase domain-containing protein/surfactin synthase thioesterase subunit/acyl carrier protein